ncbi:MAG TPA: thiamine phosphate synthase [Ktedonobacteraceae bacterium]|nr:thiamine phosphate synthase [Ktedonobacteraceae bacterium]
MDKLRLVLPLLALVTDPAVPDLVARIEAALAAGVNMVQLRGHRLAARELYTLALSIQPLCRRYQAAFIVNDRLDVGQAVGADGLQLGSRSLPLSVARQLVGERHLLGASVHSRTKAQHALKNGADFLLVGTIYPSRSHPDEPGRGTHLVRAIKQALPSVPIIAIGGITAANAAQVIEAGADGIAVISAILVAPDVEQATKALYAAILAGQAARQAKDS